MLRYTVLNLLSWEISIIRTNNLFVQYRPELRYGSIAAERLEEEIN